MAGSLSFKGVYLTGKPLGTLWDVGCKDGSIVSIREHISVPDAIPDGRILTKSLCHPHIHLDKCFLLSHSKYASLEIEHGDFAEAMNLTSLQRLMSTQDQAKARFELGDLLERGRALIEESLSYGVTHMRAFVEVDNTVSMKCLDAGLTLKREFKDRCYIQLCAFAQDPIYSQPDGGREMLRITAEVAARKGVDVIGSTPYVEVTPGNQRANIEWIIALAQKHSLHLDFHLDYNLDAKTEPSIYHVIQELKRANWTNQKAVTLGHCTRLTAFSSTEWQQLRAKIGRLPISFVGLPTSDVFMMARPEEDAGGGERLRGTLQVPQMIKKYGLQAALGVNNVGNAFTPYGSCDPLGIACLGVGLYQAATKSDAEILLECVSSRARVAIGLGQNTDLELREGEAADLVAFGMSNDNQDRGFRQRKTTAQLVYDPCHERITVYRGAVASR